MIDAPRTRTDRRFRLGGSSVLRHVAPKPVGIVSIGLRQQTVTILGAVGIDVHVLSQSPLAVGQHLTFIVSSSSRGPEIAIPGIVHWANPEGTGTGTEAGIALQEPIPNEIALKLPGCERQSIRYACRIYGKMLWIDGGPKSQPAVVINYSRDGLCMQVAAAAPVECDAQFVWWTEEEEHRIDGVVRWVIGQDEGFLAGCELVKEPGYRLAGVRF
jgi:hypothetical protein